MATEVTMTALEIIRMTMAEFSGVTDEKLMKWIELVRPLASAKFFDTQYEHAVALIAAHKMKLSGLGEALTGAGGITLANAQGLSSVSEGESSVSFDSGATAMAATDPVSAEYTKTVYGLQLLSLRRSMVMGITMDWRGIYG